MNNQELVSGYEFYKLCKWCICPRYEINFNPNEIKENDFVFLNLDYFNILLEKCISVKIKFRLISHNSDLSFTDYHFNSLKPYVHKVFAINSICNNKNVIKIPLGFVDDKYKPHFKFYNILNEKHDKNILLYMNFSINTNIEKREICYHTFKNENWIIKENNVEPLEFYKKMASSKYVLSPEGTGIDCHRIYESIFFNSIPILNTSHLDDFYNNLPVIIVKNWNEVTYDFLNKNYKKYYNDLIHWKMKHQHWLDAKYWLIYKSIYSR